MSRHELLTGNLTEQERRLLAKACPNPEDTPFFNHCMALAKAQGLSWTQGLEYVIQCRHGTPQ